MIKFIIKGLLRDRSRSLLPVLVVTAGVFLCVVATSWMQGVLNEVTWSTAIFNAGHVRVMTHAYAQEADQMPNDLALLNISGLMDTLRTQFPGWYWTPRIQFGGLLDVPDAQGETRSQAPVMGMAVDLLGKNSREPKILNLEKSLVKGRLPQQPGEILISDVLAGRLAVKLDSTATLLSSTMYGSISMYNFKVVGTVHFGYTALDRSVIIADIADAQKALDMQDGAGEILGFTDDTIYRPRQAEAVKDKFAVLFTGTGDFDPVMEKLTDQPDMLDMYHIAKSVISSVVGFFVFIMAIVLWNTGLMGSIRRYGEMGIRLAMGEAKGHVYGSLLVESLGIGAMGAVLGTFIGLLVSLYLQNVGIDISSMMNDAVILVPNVMRARITVASFVIGLSTGFFAPFLGTLISGVGIYRRQTSQLFKELEV